jgi:hypothetical protein
MSTKWDPRVQPDSTGSVNFLAPSTPTDTSGPRPTLGGAAADNVGTAHGTVAAGDDNRITGALQTTGGTMTGVFFPEQQATGSAPAYAKGGVYFDTTLNKLRVGGASAWETVTSS